MFVYTVKVLAKVLTSFKFEAQTYNSFKQLSSSKGYTVTAALERFMNSCLEDGDLVFPEHNVNGFEAEARVLVDWLGKGKRVYRGEGGAEENISGRLVRLMTKVRDSELRKAMEEVLKGSVSEQK